MVETKKTTTGESRHQYCYSCVIKYPDQNDRYAAVINRIDDQIAEKDRQMKALGRQQVCLSFAWVAWAILIAYLLFAGCSPSTSSPTAPTAPETEEPAPPPPPPPPTPDLFNITLHGVDDLPIAYWKKLAIYKAARRWERVFVEGLPDITIPRITLQGLPAPWSLYTEALDVDDIVIHVIYDAGNPVRLFGRATAVQFPIRSGPVKIPLAAITLYPLMLSAEFNFGPRDWEMVLMHEIGHALGFDEIVMHEQVGIETIGGVPYFRGQRAAVGYSQILITIGEQMRHAEIDGFAVPMAADGSGHWKHPELIWDVMNPYARGSTVFSAVTIGAMADIGYKVDMSLGETPNVSPATKPALSHSFCGGAQIHIITP